MSISLQIENARCDRKAVATRPLRVLFALPGLHRVVRGAEVAFEEVSRCIAMRRGFKVTLIGSGPQREGQPYQYRRTGCIPRERFEKFPSLPYLRDHYGYEELSFAPGLLRTFSPSHFDVTVTCGYPYTNWILRSRRNARWPRHVFVTQNGDWMIQSSDWEYKHFGCDGLICTNPEYYERHRDRVPSVLIPNGVDPQVFHPGSDDRATLGLPAGVPVILMVSALAPFKRVIEGIRCAAQLQDAYLVIAGDGEQRAQVQALGEQLMPGRFSLRSMPRSQMPNLYRSADVFLHMSQDEPSANAYIEALSTGLPIVTHDRHVTRWTLEDTSVLVNTGDEQAVADALRAALAFRSDQAIQRRRALAIQRFSWSEIAAQYCNFFEHICASDQ